ncbi:hypothetical protein [Ciceribacter sp. L1K22]|uniref:hypothetical protein n=1 Tax=Ciceribacter sp. L1K22 TaxID=2820275 RepID=UPI001ABEDE12|nr:hypothetical protein [Ciceribacter sp. L1K22]MBO3759194.1 hypothetical protein [Ciceribacter sp. L1K22]
MKLTRLLLLSSLLCLQPAPVSFAQGANSNPLVLGQFGIARLASGEEALMTQEREGWKVERTIDRLVLSNSDYDKTYSVQTESFASKIVMTRKKGDYTETYVLYGSAPNNRSRILYKIERTLEYPDKLARPRATDLMAGINRKWGSTSYAVAPTPPQPGEEISHIWYFKRDGSRVELNQGCSETLSNGEYITRYSLDDRAQIEKAESAVCNAYLSVKVKTDDQNFVERVSFNAYSNYALAYALDEDETMLRKRLEAHLDEHVRERRRILDIPQL